MDDSSSTEGYNEDPADELDGGHEVDPGEFSADLESWLRSEGPKTLGGLADEFAEKAFAVLILMLMFLPATPLPTGGVTHVFEAIALLVTIQMIIGRRTIWLPDKARHRNLGGTTTDKAIPFIIRRIRWFEKRSKPRGGFLFRQRLFTSLLGLLMTAFIAFAFIAPPFSGLDTLPALGCVIICLGIILDDIVFVTVGTGIGTVGSVLIVTLGAAAARFLTSLF